MAGSRNELKSPILALGVQALCGTSHVKPSRMMQQHFIFPFSACLTHHRFGECDSISYPKAPAIEIECNLSHQDGFLISSHLTLACLLACCCCCCCFLLEISGPRRTKKRVGESSWLHQLGDPIRGRIQCTTNTCTGGLQRVPMMCKSPSIFAGPGSNACCEKRSNRKPNWSFWGQFWATLSKKKKTSIGSRLQVRVSTFWQVGNPLGFVYERKNSFP